MSVTDTNTSQRLSSDSRNARVLSLMEEAKAEDQRAQQFLADNPTFPFRRLPTIDQRADALVAKRAKETAEWCSDCGQDIGPSNTVYIRSLSEGTGPVCEQCKCPPWDVHWRPNNTCELYDVLGDAQGCLGCGRPVVFGDLRRRKHAVCSQRCRIDAQRRERADYMASRRHTCTNCGEEYEPTRADSQYCSSACRQKAYRDRTSRETS